MKTINLTLIDNNKYEENKILKIILYDPKGGAKIGGLNGTIRIVIQSHGSKNFLKLIMKILSSGEPKGKSAKKGSSNLSRCTS